MPAPLKGALVRETARRGTNVNDVAAEILAEHFGVTFEPSGRRRKVLAGSSPVVLLRVPQELKDEIHAEASRTGRKTCVRRSKSVTAILPDGEMALAIESTACRRTHVSTVSRDCPKCPQVSIANQPPKSPAESQP